MRVEKIIDQAKSQELNGVGHFTTNRVFNQSDLEDLIKDIERAWSKAHKNAPCTVIIQQDQNNKKNIQVKITKKTK
jgi:hypothetical protein